MSGQSYPEISTFVFGDDRLVRDCEAMFDAAAVATAVRASRSSGQ